MDASDLLAEDREALPEGRDLVRKLDLERGMLDQPDPVWSARAVLQAFPPHEGRAPPSREERDIVSFVRMGSDRSKEHPGLSEMSREVMGLLRRGVLSIDAWGRHHILLDRRKGKRGMGHPGPLKGVMLRAFLLSSASSLGAFTFRDLIALSPGLGPPGRVRAMLTDLCRTHLTKCIMDGPPIEAVYMLRDLDLDAIRDRADGIASEGRVTLISRRDRMARVLSPEFAGTFGRGRGHLVLRGLEPAGLVGLKRAPSGRDEGRGHGKGRLLIGSLGKGRASRSDPLVREIRRRIFELGIATVTEEELERDRSLYGPG
jgi:hypothetical protein